MIYIERNVAYAQGANCRFLLHIGGTAIFFGRRKGYGTRLEICTPFHWFRWSRGSR